MLILFRAFKGISAIIAILALIHFGILIDHIPEMKGYGFLHKLLVLKLGIVFTEIQPNIIEIFSYTGAVTNTSIYTVEEITAYTNSLLLCFEMTMICLLMILIFPLSDYQTLSSNELDDLNLTVN